MKYYIQVIICKLSKLDNAKQISKRKMVSLESPELLTIGEIKPLIRKELGITEYISEDIVFDEIEVKLTDSDISKNDIIYEIII